MSDSYAETVRLATAFERSKDPTATATVLLDRAMKAIRSTKSDINDFREALEGARNEWIDGRESEMRREDQDRFEAAVDEEIRRLEALKESKSGYDRTLLAARAIAVVSAVPGHKRHVDIAFGRRVRREIAAKECRSKAPWLWAHLPAPERSSESARKRSSRVTKPKGPSARELAAKVFSGLGASSPAAAALQLRVVMEQLGDVDETLKIPSGGSRTWKRSAQLITAAEKSGDRESYLEGWFMKRAKLYEEGRVSTHGRELPRTSRLAKKPAPGMRALLRRVK